MYKIDSEVFVSNFERLCALDGSSPTAVCADVGLSNATYSKWKTGSVPSNVTVKKIAMRLNVTIDELTTKKEQPTETDELLNEINSIFSKQSDDVKREALNYLRYLVDKQEKP